MHLFASILLGSVDAAAINSRLAVPAGTWTTPTGLNVTVAALDLPSSFAAADPSDRRPMQKVTVHCPDGHYEEAFVAVLNATAELSPRDYVNQRADHYCKNPSPAQLQAQGFAVPQQLEKRGSWQETLSTFQFYEASRQESVRMHHANLGCQYADSQIISSTVPLSVEKVDFEQYDYFPSECVLMFYPHILAQEGQFRFVYLFRFKKSSLFSTFDDMVYDMCRNDYDKGSGRLPAWQGCDVDHPMQHNGVVLPPDNNPPPPPPPPAHNCPVNGHWSEADGKCNCNDGYYWTGKRCYACPRHSIIDGHGNCPCEQDFVLYAFECIYQKCPANGHWDVAQDRCICNDGWYWWTNQCFRCPKHSHVTGGGNCACDNGFTWLNGECVSTTCFANSHWDVGQDKCICNDGWYTWNNQCFKCPKHSHVTGGGNCGCDNGFTWLNGECVSTTCPRHSQWNVPQDRCICDNGYTWDGSNCISTQCPRHSHYDVPQDRCICDNDYLWDGSNCVYQKCPTNGHYDGNQDKCICNDGYYWNGNSCVLPSCPRHSHFNWQSLQCDCDNGYNWDGSQCAPSCPANGHYDAGQDKCVCNDGYHEDNGQCSKDMPPPPPPPPPTTPDIPSGPIFIPPPIGPPQFPPKKTVPVKPPPTDSPTKTTPSNPDPTNPPETTKPSCQGFGEGSCSTSTSTTTSTAEPACSTNNPGRDAACRDLTPGIASEFYALYMSDLTIYTNKPPHVPIELYVDGLVTDTCYAARALIMTLNAVGNNAPGLKLRNRAVSSVMSYYSDPNSCDRLSGQGFSARIEGTITDPKQNPALCAATRPADDPDAPGAPVPGFEKSSVTLPFTDPLKNSTRAFEKRQRANPEGQCAEPHAFKNLKDGHHLEVLPRVTTTVAVKAFYDRISSSDPTIIRIYFETVFRCETCHNYRIFGDVPTDRHKKMIVFDLKDRDKRNSVIPLIPLTPEIPIPHGRLLADGEQP